MMFKQVLSSGMNGVELVRQIREKDKNIKVILMSAYDPTSIEGSKEYEFVQKPIRIEKLRKLIYSKAMS